MSELWQQRSNLKDDGYKGREVRYFNNSYKNDWIIKKKFVSDVVFETAD